MFTNQQFCCLLSSHLWQLFLLQVCIKRPLFSFSLPLWRRRPSGKKRKDSIEKRGQASSYLSGREYGNVILIDDSGFLLYQLRTALLLEILARQPEEDVLLAVLAAQKGAENFAALCKKKRSKVLSKSDPKLMKVVRQTYSRWT